MRKKITSDPNTALIAKALGMPYHDYVESVVKYALNPNMELQVDVLPEETVKAMGIQVPTDAELADFVNGLVAADALVDSTDYREKSKELVALPLEPAQTQSEKPIDPDLAAEVLKRRSHK